MVVVPEPLVGMFPHDEHAPDEGFAVLSSLEYETELEYEIKIEPANSGDAGASQCGCNLSNLDFFSTWSLFWCICVIVASNGHHFRMVTSVVFCHPLANTSGDFKLGIENLVVTGRGPFQTIKP